MRAVVLLSLMVLVLASCTADQVNSTYTPLGSEPHSIGSAYQVTPVDSWQKYSSTADVDFLVHWTSGRSHSANFALFHDLSEGDALFRYTDPDFPLFRADMTPEEVATLLRETMKLRGMLSIETENVRPAKFGSLPGFKFDTNYVRSNSTLGRGSVLGTIINGRLQLIYFTSGVESFDEYVDDAEFMMESVVLQ
ncbi:hypothetical protein [Pelagibius sp. Alg239-R121]|uniref:hypothetical protein n=1 Tax=Pelagibius sp. Alg239-R121 TaxID=2993448 RepID=UPI0024A6B109|nr:hypothetical protein [Pelagibius sp. Alg239-R121]